MQKKEQNNNRIYPVILCGGAGSRLWPVSREELPKQFIPLVSGNSLLQDTLALVSDPERFEIPTLLTNEKFRFLATRQAEEIGVSIGATILEPHRRNTAPAIALAALMLAETDPRAVMLVLPSDHAVRGTPLFNAAADNAAKLARQGYLVTFGRKPDRPETGYGYIQRGEALPEDGCFRVARFVEKPDLPTAERLLAEGGHDWNSGMYMFTAERYLESLESYKPDLLAQARQSLAGVAPGTPYIMPNAEAFAAAEDISIDYAVMERTPSAAMVVARFGWSDVGSWSAISDLRNPDNDGNVVTGDAVLEDCNGTYVNAQNRLVAAVGMIDHVIVETTDSVLVAPKSRVQDVKKVVARLRSDARPEADNHAKVERPWGSYEGVHHGAMHQVKHIVVAPGQRLSSQYHHYRAEHWVVVSGTAEVTVDDVTQTLGENNSVYIPVKAVHRLYNPGDEPLHLIEVQYGSYLGEDDIVRLDDVYGRVPQSAQEAAE